MMRMYAACMYLLKHKGQVPVATYNANVRNTRSSATAEGQREALCYAVLVSSRYGC